MGVVDLKDVEECDEIDLCMSFDCDRKVVKQGETVACWHRPVHRTRLARFVCIRSMTEENI